MFAQVSLLWVVNMPPKHVAALKDCVHGRGVAVDGGAQRLLRLHARLQQACCPRTTHSEQGP